MAIKKADAPMARGSNIDDLREFLDSGWDCAEVELGRRGAGSAYRAYSAAIRRHSEFEGIRVTMSKGRLFLVRR